jgi:peptidoglycan/xylan/chitin deacetylase (PgdA/CDA1 family)
MAPIKSDPMRKAPADITPEKTASPVRPTATVVPAAVAAAPKVLAQLATTPEPTQIRLPTATPLPTRVSSSTPSPTTIPAGLTALRPEAAAIVIRRVATIEKLIALTYDAGADRGEAASLLAYLEVEGIRVTFGMTGRWAEENPDLLRRIIADGDTLMNHTYDHRSMTGLSGRSPVLSRPDRIDEIARADAIVQSLGGTTMKPFFRPPYGDENGSVLADVAAAGYRYSVLWSVDTLGWRGASVEQIVARSLRYAEPGAIYVLHVGGASKDIEATSQIVDGLRARGYGFVTLSQLIGQPAR